MKLAVMQPYFFPYIGYYQLVAAVDAFVFYDDVNYINRGWINRNRVLVQGTPKYITVPLAGASQNRTIAEIAIDGDKRWRRVIVKTLEHSYAKAPHAGEVLPMVRKVLEVPAESIAELARHSVIQVAEHLGMRTRFIESSSAFHNAHLRGEERILDLCEQTGASTYINAIGGRELYKREHFTQRGIELRFLEPHNVRYSQGQDEFVPWLSIIDVMIHLGRKGTTEMLRQYTLVQ